MMTDLTKTARFYRHPENFLLRSYSPENRRFSTGWSALGITTPVLFLTGSALNQYAFGDLNPVLAALLFFIPAWAVVAGCTTRTPEIRIGFSWLLAFYWFCAGLAAIWDEKSSLPFISFIDAYNFYNITLFEHIGIDLEAVQRRSEGALAILIWHWSYGLASELGLGNGPYIGIVVNILFMAGTGVVSAQMLTIIAGRDPGRYLKLFLAFSLNGLFLIFVTTHVRDAFVCFFVSFFSYFWVGFLKKKKFSYFVVAAAMSFVAVIIMYYLRDEFKLMSLVLFGAAVGSLVLSSDVSGSSRSLIRIFGIVLGFGLLIFIISLSSEMSAVFDKGDTYSAWGKENNAGNSLGVAFVISQPLPIRLIVGPAYSMFMPLPVWVGFELGTVYQIGKSLGAIFAYFFVPALLARLWCMIKVPSQRWGSSLFLLSVFIIFLFAISITSLESRHVAAFMPLAIVAIIGGATDIASYRIAKSKLQLWFFVIISVAHMTWFALKTL